MTAEVEFRRFRTWETDPQARPSRNWWLIVRSLTQRYYRTWYLYMVVVLGLFGAVLGIFLMNLMGSEAPRGVDPHIISEAPMSFIGIGMALFVMLVTAPSIAEDVRFNAQLFYFSKPMRIGDYMLGKNAFNFIGLALVGLIPTLVLSATALSIGPGSEAAMRQYYAREGMPAARIDEAIREWKIAGVDTWAEAFYVAGMPLLAVISLSVGLVGVTMAMSSFTRRAWHAAVGTVIFVTGWSILGEVAAVGEDTTRRLLYHPGGWLEAVAFLPFDHKFRQPFCYEATGRSFCDWYFESLRHAGTTIWTAHALLVGIGILGIIVTWLRLKRLEGAA